MSPKYFFAAIGIGWALTGCSSRMAVNVHVFNDEDARCLPIETRLRTDLRRVAEETAILESRVPEVRSTILTALDQLIYDPNQNVPDPSEVRVSIVQALDGFLANIVRPRRQGIDAFYAAERDSNGEDARRRLWRTRLKFIEGDRATLDLITKIDNLGSKIFHTDGRLLAAKLDPLKRYVQTTLVSNALVLEDPLAPLITAIPEKNSQGPDCWRSIFNTARASTTLGNSDIAIVMTGLGDFSIKGVRLDAAAVTAATFDGIRSGISIVAAASGLTSKLATGSAGSASSAGALSPPITAPNFENEGRLAVRRGVLEPAARDFLRTLLVHRNDLTNETGRKAAIIEVKQSFEALRFVLNPAASATPVIASP